MGRAAPWVRWFDEIGLSELPEVGGKNASLGEMVQHLSAAGVSVPDGFATTADAYRRFLAHEGLADRVNGILAGLDVEDTRALSQAGAWLHRSSNGQRLNQLHRRPQSEFTAARPEHYRVAEPEADLGWLWAP